MHLAAAILGASLVGFLLYDVFHTIFNPRGNGSIGDIISLACWRLFRIFERRIPDSRPYAGPISMLLILLSWAVSLIFGWALIFWSMMPGRFLFPAGMLQGSGPGFLDALYMSSLTLIILSGGEMAPVSRPARLLVPLEGLLGFAIFSASISWILSVYPVLNRRRVLANELFDIRRIEEDEGRDFLAAEPDYVSTVVHGIAQRLLEVRGDIVQFPITFYFQAMNPDRDVPALLPYALRLAKRCQQHTSQSVSNAGRFFEFAIRDYLVSLAPLLRRDTASPAAELISTFQDEHST